MVWLVCVPSVAAAQASASSEAAAETLYLEAERLVESGRFALACKKFLESQRLDPQLGTLLHLADCYEQNGQTASSWVTFREAAELATRKGDARVEVAKARVEGLTSRLSMLTIEVPSESDVPGLGLSRDGQPVPPAMWGTPIPVDPGKTRLTADAAGREPWVQELEITQPGQTLVRVPVLAPRPPPPPPSEVAKTSSGSTGARTGTMTTLGWLAVATGAVGLGVGGTLAAVAASRGADADNICRSGRGCTHDEITRYDSVYSDAESAAIGARISVGIGAAVLATGVVLLILDWPKSRVLARGAFAW
jgi:serine/threonine-protein kinase